MDKQDRHYEDLYRRLRERGETMHMNNKKRIRIGLIVLALLPAILIFIRWATDSDRVVFLIIWVLCMFAACIYLISIEFIEDAGGGDRKRGRHGKPYHRHRTDRRENNREARAHP